MSVTAPIAPVLTREEIVHQYNACESYDRRRREFFANMMAYLPTSPDPAGDIEFLLAGRFLEWQELIDLGEAYALTPGALYEYSRAWSTHQRATADMVQTMIRKNPLAAVGMVLPPYWWFDTEGDLRPTPSKKELVEFLGDMVALDAAELVATFILELGLNPDPGLLERLPGDGSNHAMYRFLRTTLRLMHA